MQIVSDAPHSSDDRFRTHLFQTNEVASVFGKQDYGAFIFGSLESDCSFLTQPPFQSAKMAYVQSTSVYAWKEKLLGKPCFKPYRLFLYSNGRLLLEKQDSEIKKGSANLCDIFPYIRIGALDTEIKKDRAASEGLTLAYHTLIIPLESSKGPGPSRWREHEFAVSFDREIKEWMASFAHVLSFKDQFDDVVRKYHERKKSKAFGSSYRLTQGSFEETDEEDPARLWATARGSGDDYAAIWSAFLDHCSAKVEGGPFDNGHGFPLPSCLKAFP